MADTPAMPMIDARPLMAAEMKARADQLASILDIPVGSYDGHESEAYQIMGHLAAMPTIADHGQRRQYGNEILTNAAKVFSPWSPDGSRFHTALQSQVIMMQEFPAYYSTVTESNEKLVEDYVTITTILDAMKIAGFGGFAGAGGKVLGGARSGAYKALEAGGNVGRMAADAVKGAASGGIGAAKKLATGGLVSRSAIFVWVVGEVAYSALSTSQVKLQLEITRRFQEGRLSSGLYQRAMGSAVPPPARYLFPVK